LFSLEHQDKNLLFVQNGIVFKIVKMSILKMPLILAIIHSLYLPGVDQACRVE